MGRSRHTSGTAWRERTGGAAGRQRRPDDPLRSPGTPARRGGTGARTGAAYEEDPSGVVDWEDSGDYPGCVATRNVGASQPYASISAAVASAASCDFA